MLNRIARKNILYLAALVIASSLFGAGCGNQESRKIRSVVLITIDTLRADHLNYYGYSEPTTPNLDRFMSRGVVFQHAFSTSCRTAPSHVSLMTGLYPSFTSVDVDNGSHPLNKGFETLAELCQAEGMQTAAIVGNPVLGKRLALDQGFDSYDDVLPDRERNRNDLERTADNTRKSSIAKIKELTGSSFFLWIHFQDPHGPYTAPKSFLPPPAPSTTEPLSLPVGANHSGYKALPAYQVLEDEQKLAEYVRRYDAEIRYLDSNLGQVLETLQSEGILSESLVVITADHGEAFGEDDFFCAHGHGLGIDQTRVPLAFVGPGIQAETRLKNGVSNLDAFATILDALDLAPPPGTQSESLLPFLQNGTEPMGRIGYAESVTQRAAFQGDFYLRADRHPLSDLKFWKTGNPFTGAPYIPLGEKDHRHVSGKKATSPPEESLASALDSFTKIADKARSELLPLRQQGRPLSQEEKDRLRALGYLK